MEKVTSNENQKSITLSEFKALNLLSSFVIMIVDTDESGKVDDSTLPDESVDYCEEYDSWQVHKICLTRYDEFAVVVIRPMDTVNDYITEFKETLAWAKFNEKLGEDNIEYRRLLELARIKCSDLMKTAGIVGHEKDDTTLKVFLSNLKIMCINILDLSITATTMKQIYPSVNELQCKQTYIITIGIKDYIAHRKELLKIK